MSFTRKSNNLIPNYFSRIIVKIKYHWNSLNMNSLIYTTVTKNSNNDNLAKQNKLYLLLGQI